MADFDQQSLPVTILVLDGPFAGQEISLQERALPYRPITFEGRQRVKTTWYPGNPVATQQLLGPTEEPTVIMGTWKDRFLGDGVARQLMQTFDDLRRSGSLVEFRFAMGVLGAGAGAVSTVGNAIIRRGVITRTKFPLERPQDVPFEIEFTWRGRDEAVQPPLTAAGIANPREGFNELADDIDQTDDAIASFRQSALLRLLTLPQAAQDAIDDVLNQLAGFSSGIRNVTSLVSATVDLAPNTANQVMGIATGTIAATQELIDTILGLNLAAIVPHDDALALLAQQRQNLALLEQATALQETAVVMRSGLEAQQLPEVIAEVFPPSGTDLRDLARQFYGDPDLWWIIAKFNGLPDSQVPSLPSGPADILPGAIQIPRRHEGQMGELSSAGC